VEPYGEVRQAFAQLVDAASKRNAAARTYAEDLKQFAKLRNAIVHDSAYPPQIIAVPSEEAIRKYSHLVRAVLEPAPLAPTFSVQVRCFSLCDPLTTVIAFMKHNDFSQVVVKGGDRRLSMLTVEGITMWLAGNLDKVAGHVENVTLQAVIAHEPAGAFIVLAATKTVFDASDAFTNSIHLDATRLYAIIVTETGDDTEDPVGLVTPWDLVHNPCRRRPDCLPG
jgi:hypothetical protein